MTDAADHVANAYAIEESRLETAEKETAALREQVRVLESRCNSMDLATLGFKRVERLMLKDRSSNECLACGHAASFHSKLIRRPSGALGHCIACENQDGLEMPDRQKLTMGPCALVGTEPVCRAASEERESRPPPEVIIIVGGARVTVGRSE
jgi:Zn ribbon nucleic-acid-binding protein